MLPLFYCSPTCMALHVVHNQLLKQGQSSLVYPAIFTIMNPYEPGFHSWISNHYVTAVMVNNNYYNNQIHRKYGSVCHLYLITATIILTTVIIGGFSGDEYSPETPDHQSGLGLERPYRESVSIHLAVREPVGRQLITGSMGDYFIIPCILAHIPSRIGFVGNMPG